MSSIRVILARACLRLYPAAWRARYGDEVLALGDEAGFGIGDLVDLALGGLRRRAEELSAGEGGDMAPHTSPRIAAMAAAAALIVAAPTAIFFGLNLAGTAVDWEPWLTVSLPALPSIALVVAVAPALRIGLRRDNADGIATVTVRILAVPAWLVAVVLACGVLVLAVLTYGIVENLPLR